MGREYTALAVSREESGFLLKGAKCFVPEGMAANLLIVAARTGGQPGDHAGITLFLVDGEATGVERTRLSLVDHRGHADIEFSDVVV